MRRLPFLSLFAFFSAVASAQWTKINDVDYVWGPFKIYTLSLFTETGQYQVGTRPLMLSLKYAKPVDGRDFAISLARSWSNLGITLANQDDVVDRLRKIMPNIREDDVLSYIALEDKGYFVLNDTIIPEEFNQEFNDAVVAVWLDPRVEIGRKLLHNQSVFQAHKAEAIESSGSVERQAAQAETKPAAENETAAQPAPANSAPNSEAAPQNEAKPTEAKPEEPKPQAVEYPNPESETLPPYDAPILATAAVV